MALIDAELHQALTWMSENDITEAGLERDYVDEYENFGAMESFELVPGGAGIPVTEANKMEYIRLSCQHRLVGRVEGQLVAFRRGLHEIVAEDALAIFDEHELEVRCSCSFDAGVEMTFAAASDRWAVGYRRRGCTFLMLTRAFACSRLRAVEEAHRLPRIRRDRPGRQVVLGGELSSCTL